MQLKLTRTTPTFARIACIGGRVLDRKSGQVYSEVECSCKTWQSDEQVLADYEAV